MAIPRYRLTRQVDESDENFQRRVAAAAGAQDVDARLAAHEMFGVPAGRLVGATMHRYLPVFVSALAAATRERPIRTSISGWARRAAAASWTPACR